jgi:formate dehydrogenase subunit delta
MHPEYLIRMANDIASFFAAESDKEQAARNVHAHIKRYWDPRMRARIVAHYRAGGEGLEGIVRSAVAALADEAAAKQMQSGA